MSFDLMVWDSTSPVTLDHARRTLDQIGDGDYSSLTDRENFRAFMTELTERYPPLESLTESTFDESPWTSGLVVRPGYVEMSLAWSKVETVAPCILELSRKHGLYLYDPQEDEFYLPSG